jgi:hypothetical protein
MRWAGRWPSVASSSKVMIASDRWVRQAGEFMICVSSALRKASPAAMPQPSMSVQSLGATQAKFGVLAVVFRSRPSSSSGTTCAAQYAGRSRTSLK